MSDKSQEAERERAAIVEWVREEAQICRGHSENQLARLLEEVAKDIEDSKHG